MNQGLKGVAWYQALTLRERIAALDTLEPAIDQEFDEALAERRWQRWRSQTPFPIDSYYTQRLATDGLTPESFRYLLGESIAALQQRSPTQPDWLNELENAFSRTEPPKIKIIPSSQLSPGKESLGFLYAIEPLISQGIERLDIGIQFLLNRTESQTPFDPNTIHEIFYQHLPQPLLQMLSQTLILELNVARLQGLLSGNSPRERFLSFLERIYQRDVMLGILQEYPVLARQLVTCIERWVKVSLEFIQRLCTDWDEICRRFSPHTNPGVLTELKPNTGDSHRGGRSVAIAKFSAGFQIVYKPKSLAIDVHFQELLTWLNHRGNHPAFKTLNILNRGNYGWVEFVTAHSCHSPEEVQRFYQRIGGYLALLYALEATDFHSENLIAAGEQPILIDLESLFHPRRTTINTTHLKESVFMASQQLAYSVLRVGLLPNRRWTSHQSKGLDKSGIGSQPGQTVPRPIRSWEGVATDEMRVVRQQRLLQGAQNQPRLLETEVNVLDYAEEIVTGFTTVYQDLVKYRDEFQNRLTHFAEDEIRVVLRPTRTYAALLAESFHPDVLRNALERDRWFDKLWIEVQHLPDIAKVIQTERQELWQGDIPMFTTRPNSRDVVGSHNQIFANFFERSGMEQVVYRLEQLDERDLERQTWFIRASVSTLAMAQEGVGWRGYPRFEPQTRCDREQLLAAACQIGDRLELLALRSHEDATWLGLTLAGGSHWTLASLTWSLYDGLPGVALFLAYLGAITQEKRYTKLAQAAFRTLEHQIQQGQSLIPTIGGFSGWGGVIYTLTHLGVLWEQPERLTEAEELIHSIRGMIETDEYFDLIGGAAGCIASLLALYHCFPSDAVLAAAIECGDR